MKRKLQLLLTMLLLCAGVNSAWGQQSPSVTTTTGDTWVRTDNRTTNYGSQTTIEMQKHSNGTTRFYGVMQFKFEKPQLGYKVKSAKLRLTTRFKKGDSKLNIYGLDAEVTDDSDYNGLEAKITSALEGGAITSVNLKGYNQWAPTDGAVVNEDGGAAYRVVSAWQNTIDLTSYVKSLSDNTFAILLEKDYSQDNSSQVFSKEAQNISLNDNSVTFSADDLKPQLTVEYEKIYARVSQGETISDYSTLNEAFDAISSEGTITLYNDIAITGRCDTGTKTITVVPAKAGITVSSTITNNIWLLNNQSAGNLTIGSDTYAMTIDGGNYSVGYAHIAAEHGSTTIKNVTFKNCKGTSDNGVVHLKSQNSSATLHLNNVTFDGCTVNEGRGVVTDGTNNLYLEGAITFRNCSAGSYNIYLQNVFLRIGDLSLSQVAPIELYYQTPSLQAIVLSASDQKDKSALFKLMNDDFGIIKDPSHTTDHKITEAYTMTMNEYGATTLILPYAAKIPTYAETAVYTLNYTAEKTTVKATEVDATIPANTPVLVNATAGEKLWFVNTAKVDAVTVGAGTHTIGALTGVYATTDVPSGSYILYADASNPIGFYKANSSTVGANRAYLTADGAGARVSISFGDDDPTGIVATMSQQMRGEQEYYDLQGRRVAHPTKGLYIVNGKKVIIK